MKNIDLKNAKISVTKSVNLYEADDDGNIIKKRCIKCLMMLPIEEFHKNEKTRDGYHNTCKRCLKKD